MTKHYDALDAEFTRLREIPPLFPARLESDFNRKILACAPDKETSRHGYWLERSGRGYENKHQLVALHSVVLNTWGHQEQFLKELSTLEAIKHEKSQGIDWLRYVINSSQLPAGEPSLDMVLRHEAQAVRLLEAWVKTSPTGAWFINTETDQVMALESVGLSVEHWSVYEDERKWHNRYHSGSATLTFSSFDPESGERKQTSLSLYGRRRESLRETLLRGGIREFDADTDHDLYVKSLKRLAAAYSRYGDQVSIKGFASKAAVEEEELAWFLGDPMSDEEDEDDYHRRRRYSNRPSYVSGEVLFTGNKKSRSILLSLPWYWRQAHEALIEENVKFFLPGGVPTSDAENEEDATDDEDYNRDRYSYKKPTKKTAKTKAPMPSNVALVRDLSFELEEGENLDKVIADYLTKDLREKLDFLSTHYPAMFLYERLLERPRQLYIRGKDFSAAVKNEDVLIDPMFAYLPCLWQVYMMNVESKSFYRAPISSIKQVNYNSKAASGLQLDPEIKDLIMLLASERGVNTDDSLAMDSKRIKVSARVKQNADIVEGKGASTIIALMGPPGVGKTLSAEITAESLMKPLYIVAASELGMQDDKVERNLSMHLARSERWDVVTLIDEADVFLASRGDDLQRNAIVSAMLRKLEYYSGLLFLTTNRVSDIDDAFISRCSAVITYTLPDPAPSARLWKQYADLAGLPLSTETIADLSRTLQLSGRTIQRSTSLAARVWISADSNKFVSGSTPADADKLIRMILKYVPKSGTERVDSKPIVDQDLDGLR